MQKATFKSLIELYSEVPEPRVVGRCKHKLVDILVIITCSYLCGISDWEEIELFANERKDWFKKYLELPNGIPSHDTLLRTFKIIDAKAFELIFFEWIQSVVKLKKNQVVAFDGKKVSGTFPWCGSEKGQALSLLNIWAVGDEITLGQKGIKETGYSEPGGIKDCLDYLNLEGMIVTADAASSVLSVAQKIIEKKAHYLLPIKYSQKAQSKALKNIGSLKIKWGKYSLQSTVRGREEKRVCEVIHDKKIIKSFVEKYKWPELKTIGIIKYYRKEKDMRIVIPTKQEDGSYKLIKNRGEYKELREEKFYLCSKRITAKSLLTKAQSHWHLENKLNWQLDVTFKEDANRTRDKVAAENMSMIRKICLNILKSEKTFNKSLKLKSRKCLINEAYLEKTLFNS
jgi:predicted transposase YbfD/YdcC